jgi:two-component system chemotaxis response regulator CheY
VKRTKKILLVDDAEFVQHIYRVCFRRTGNATLFHAYNGMEALQVLEREGPMELIILDLNMPIMGGLEFLAELKKRPRHDGTHVLIVTTEDKDDLIRKAMQLGASSYLKKPFTVDQFLAFVEKVFSSLPIRSASGGSDTSLEGAHGARQHDSRSRGLHPR